MNLNGGNGFLKCRIINGRSVTLCSKPPNVEWSAIDALPPPRAVTSDFEDRSQVFVLIARVIPVEEAATAVVQTGVAANDRNELRRGAGSANQVGNVVEPIEVGLVQRLSERFDGLFRFLVATVIGGCAAAQKRGTENAEHRRCVAACRGRFDGVRLFGDTFRNRDIFGRAHARIFAAEVSLIQGMNN